ncbi:MAG: helix-turn-helix transcriptional regulator [Candidatus Limnocylindrales bacterium]|jgi:transcriptional regulator with XRE-family HTH domain
MPETTRRRVTVDDTPLARSIGARIRQARLQAGLTQQQLAGDRYTKAYVSALENGSSKPSMAALNYLATRLYVPAAVLLAGETDRWSRLEGDVLLASGRWQEALDIHDRHLAEAPRGGARAELLRGRAEALARLDRGPEAIAAGSEAAEIFDRLGREADAALARYWVASGEYLQGNLVEARRLTEAILAKVRAGLRVDPDFHLRLVIALAAVETRDGEYDRALAYLSEVRGLAERLDDRRRATYFFDLAHSYRETGDYEAAVRTGYASLTLFAAMHADAETAALENDLALAFVKLGNLSRANEFVASARTRFETLGNARWLAHIADTEAQIALAGSAFDRAATLAEQAIEGAELTGNQKALIDALVTRAQIRRRCGDSESADGDFARAADLARASGSRGRIREVLGAWSEMLAESGNLRRAYDLTREALSV